MYKRCYNLAMEQALLNAGLSPQQAQAYIFVLDNFPATPADIATHLKLSRTNAYKLADKLVELGLVLKAEENNKIAYRPADPIALSGLVAEARTKMIALEKATKQAMKIIQHRLEADEHTDAKVYRGKAAIVELFQDQARKDLPLYFLSTAADLPVMSFLTMHQVRRLHGPSKNTRYGITPDVPGAVKSTKIDATTQLLRTWMPRNAYTSPVEWSTCGDDLYLFIYASEPYAIKISDKHVADAFRQIWQNLDAGLRESKEYQKLPRYADRTV